MKDGGCDIIGYAVFMDDGLGVGNYNEVNILNDPNVRNQPGLTTLDITAFSLA